MIRRVDLLSPVPFAVIVGMADAVLRSSHPPLIRHAFRPVHNYAFGLIGASVGRWDRVGQRRWKAREEGQRVGRLVFVGTDGMSIGDNVTAESPCDAATIASERQPLQEWSVTSSSEAADASVC